MNELAHAMTMASRGPSPLDLLLVLFGLSIVPLLAVSTTSFTRIVVVLGLLRASLGASTLPPNSVIAALAIMLSVVIMGPTLVRVQHSAAEPYLQRRISATVALTRGGDELKRFMLRQTRASDVATFSRYASARELSHDLNSQRDPAFEIVAPAFMVSELRAAFAMGFAFALPFAAIDIVVAAVMMSLGMFMVSPSSIALPIKLLLFVAADGWTTVCGTLIQSFR